MSPPASNAAARRDVSPRSVPPRAASPQTAAPGVFYAVERVSVKTATGVKALHPGEEVRLMYRYKDGSMLVTTGHDEFVLKPSALTKDRELAARIAPQ